jgi:3-phosphoinositide dependent protein kinase-1
MQPTLSESSLCVLLCWEPSSDILNRSKVTEPTARLGLAPHSSPQDLRDHPFFTRSDAIDWGTLWTRPAPKIEPDLDYKKKMEAKEEELLAKFEKLELEPDNN